MSLFKNLFSGKNTSQSIQQNGQDSADADYWYEQGSAKVENNDPKKAIKDFTRAIEMNPEHPLAYGSRGFAYAMIRKYKQAIKDLTKAIEQAPDVAATYYYRGECYILSESAKQPEAIRDFNKAIELNPDYAEAYLSRAKALGFMGLVHRKTVYYEKSLSDYQTFLKLVPDAPEAPRCLEVMEILERRIKGEED